MVIKKESGHLAIILVSSVILMCILGCSNIFLPKSLKPCLSYDKTTSRYVQFSDFDSCVANISIHLSDPSLCKHSDNTYYCYTRVSAALQDPEICDPVKETSQYTHLKESCSRIASLSATSSKCDLEDHLCKSRQMELNCSLRYLGTWSMDMDRLGHCCAELMRDYVAELENKGYGVEYNTSYCYRSDGGFDKVISKTSKE